MLVGVVCTVVMSQVTAADDLKNRFVDQYGVAETVDIVEALNWEGLAKSNDESGGDLAEGLLSISEDVDDFGEEVLNVVTLY